MDRGMRSIASGNGQLRLHPSLGAIILLVALRFPAQATNPGDPGEMLDFGAGARSLGMGTAYTAIAQDATSAYWNPAGLAAVNRHEFNFLHTALNGGATYDYMGYGGMPLFGGVLGGDIARLGVSGADLRDANNNLLGSFNYSETALGVGYGMALPQVPTLGLGVGAHTLMRSLQTSNDTLTGLDLAGQYAFNRSLGFGAICRNVLSTTQGDTSDKLPRDVRLGVGYQPFTGLTLSVDMDNFSQFFLGAEYTYSVIALRGGMMQNSPTIGMGLRFKDITMDVAMAMNSDLDTTMHLSLGYAFGKPKQGGPKRFVLDPDLSVADLLDHANWEMDRGYYTEAEGLLRTAHRVKRHDEKVQDLLDRLSVITPYVHSMPGWDRPSKMARTGINDYLKGDAVDSLWFMTYAFSIDKNQTGLERVILEVSRLSGYQVSYESNSPLSLTQQVLNQALNEFRVQHYDAVVDLCQRVIGLEPNKALAYIRMGSALYALHQYEAAQASWHKALAYETDGKMKQLLTSFIERAHEASMAGHKTPAKPDVKAPDLGDQDETDNDDENAE